MTFDPSGTWLLTVTGKGNLYIVPALALLVSTVTILLCSSWDQVLRKTPGFSATTPSTKENFKFLEGQLGKENLNIGLVLPVEMCAVVIDSTSTLATND